MEAIMALSAHMCKLLIFRTERFLANRATPASISCYWHAHIFSSLNVNAFKNQYNTVYFY